jgi:Ca2+-binding EF-hand superfamily protein
MMRAFLVIGAWLFVPAVTSAQQPCTTDASAVVIEIHRQILERAPDDIRPMAQRLTSGSATVKDLVREVARGTEHIRRFLSPFDTPQQRLNAVGYLYRHLLNRAPDIGGARGYADAAASRGIEFVIDAILASPEYQQAYGDYGVPGSNLRYCGPNANRSTGTTGAQAATRMRFSEMDSNRDGQIVRAEWRGSTQSFKVHDWNGDGVLSGDEVRPGAARTRRMEEEDYTPGNVNSTLTWSDADFRSLDRNNDRRITPAEWYYDVETFRRADRNGDGVLSAAEFFAPEDDDRNDSFEYLDVNGNGRIELNEWHGSAAEFRRLDRNRDNVLSRAEVLGSAPAAATPPDLFATLDADGDAMISPVEWRWSLRSFYQQDTNDDGFVTRNEFTGAPAGAPAR